MSPRFRHYASSLLDRFFQNLAQTANGRGWLEYGIDRAYYHLGVGAGGDVNSSGEQIALDCVLGRLYGGNRLCIFDVGANHGQFLQILLKGKGSRAAQIHCFEPLASTFAALAKTKTSEEVLLNSFGLGAVPGEFPLYFDAEGSGLASLSKRRLGHFDINFERSALVRIETLDNYCSRLGIAKIDLLKIDVEGHEMDVLHGGMRMMSEGRVRTVLFEFGGCNIDSRIFFQDFYYFFEGLGMRGIFRISPAGTLIPIERYRESLEQFRTTNFVVFLAD